MSICDSFYTQLGSIMEELANAAVAEICKLVDDGYAVLRLEMSRSHKENEALRKKLQLMEMHFSQQYTKYSGVVEDSLQPGSGFQVNDVLGKNKKEGLCEDEGKIRGQLSHVSARKRGDPAVTNKEDSDIMPSVMESVDNEESEHEVLLVKEEEIDEDERIVGPHPETKTNGESYMEFVSDGFETQPLDIPERGKTDLNSCKRAKERFRAGSESETILKEEPGPESLCQRLKHIGSKHSPRCANASGTDYIRHEQLHQVKTVSQAKTDLENTERLCSLIPAADTKNPFFNFDHRLVPTQENITGDDVSCAKSLDVTPEVAMMDILPMKTCKMNSELNKTVASENVITQNGPSHSGVNKMVMEAQSIVESSLLESQDVLCHKSGSESTVQLYPSDTSDCFPFSTFIPSKNIKSHHKTGLREKRFFCKYCGVGFSFPNEVKVHQRRHTGEKPFSCVLCGKRFSQASYLKVHQRVHTGEKPFSCKHCGKRFGQSGYLNVHQRIHTGEKPFSCLQCGKSFTRSNHLKRHQSVHVGEKLITVMQ